MKEKNLTGKGKYTTKAVNQPLKLVQKLKDNNCKVNYNYNTQLKDTYKDVKYDTKI